MELQLSYWVKTGRESDKSMEGPGVNMIGIFNGNEGIVKGGIKRHRKLLEKLSFVERRNMIHL